jgi:xanthine dehydrogenase YagS FAD-binding subunit
MNRFAWASPSTVQQAAAAASATVADAMIAAQPGARGPAIFKAGGVDVLDLMKERLLEPDALVNLRDVPGLNVIGEEAGGLKIGAMVTLAALGRHALVRQHYPALADAAAASASPQIRSQATLGGNLLQRPRCWYFRSQAHHCLRKGGEHCFAFAGENQHHAIFDHAHCAIVHPSTLATPLVALGAKVELVDAMGASRQVSLEDFFVPPSRDPHRENDLKPQEILTAARLPPLGPGVRMAHLKQGEKESFDWPLADVAVVLDRGPDGRCRSASVVLGAAAPTPHRAKAAEAALIGKQIDETAARAAARAALEGAEPLSQNAYKLPLFETLARRAILAAVA